MSAAAIKAGQAFVEITARDDKLQQTLTSSEKRMRNFAKRAAVLGAAAVVGTAAAGIAAASSLEETLNKFNVVFGDNSEAVKNWGETFGQEVGRSKRQVLEFLAGTQDLLIPMGFEEGAAEQLSKDLTSLAVDVASFNNKADADVLRDFHAAMTGGGETVKKYGVIVNVATTNQKLLQNAIEPKTATEAEKAWARYQIILESTTAAQGDAVRSGDSFANQLKRMKGNIEDTAASLGEALLPAASSLLKLVNELLVPLAQWLSQNSETVEVMLKVAAGVAAVVVVMRTLRQATMAAAKAQAVLQALSGPKGWLVLAGAAAAAAFSITAIDSALGGTTDALQDADAALDKTTGKMEAQAAAGGKLEESWRKVGEGQKRWAAQQSEWQKSIAAVTDLQDKQESSAVKLAKGLKVLEDHDKRAHMLNEKSRGKHSNRMARTGYSESEMEGIRSDMIEKATGFRSEMERIHNETGRINGSLSETDILLAKMEKRGLPKEELEEYRAALEELEKTKKEAEDRKEQEGKDKEAAKEAEDRFETLKNRADDIRESLKTPAERFADLNAEMKKLVKAGVLDRQAAREYLQAQRGQARQDIADRRKQQDRGITQTASQDMRSAGGANLINRLLNQTSTADEKIEQHTKKTAANTAKIARRAERKEVKV